jgi:hypothetical protein
MKHLKGLQMKIIGIFGQMKNGKDETANYLVKKLNENKWKRIGFADAVKKVFMDSFNISLEFIEEWKRKDEPPPGFDLNVRKSLQHIGDGFRKIKSDIWIDIALRNNDKDLVISDGRYINEGKVINKNSGFAVLLWRPEFENDDSNPSEAQIKPLIDWCLETNQDGMLEFHSENFPEDIKNFDFFLRNDGTIADLYSRIDNFLIPCLIKRGFDDEYFRI